ncbi:MAG: HAD-IB family phosphatase [Nitrosotalea sp.]
MKKNKKLIALDMDGTLLDGTLIRNLAKDFDFTDDLYEIQKDPNLLGYQKTEKIAALLKGFNELDIIETISKMKMVKNWRQTIEEIKAHEHVIGIISDSYTLACNYLRKKMDLDFAVANELQTDENHILSGKVSMPLGWNEIGCNCRISVCKRYHLEKLAQQFHISLSNTVVVGDTVSDLCMIERAGIGVALMPKDDILKERSDVVITTPDLSKIIPIVI